MINNHTEIFMHLEELYVNVPINEITLRFLDDYFSICFLLKDQLKNISLVNFNGFNLFLGNETYASYLELLPLFSNVTPLNIQDLDRPPGNGFSGDLILVSAMNSCPALIKLKIKTSALRAAAVDDIGIAGAQQQFPRGLKELVFEAPSLNFSTFYNLIVNVD